MDPQTQQNKQVPAGQQPIDNQTPQQPVTNQDYNPYNYTDQPGSPVGAAQPYQAQQDLSQQVPQPQPISPSPEVPATAPEVYPGHEMPAEAITEKGTESQRDVEQKKETPEQKAIEAPLQAPDQTASEKPATRLKMYGYQATQQAIQQGKKAASAGQKVKGNPTMSKTWLFVLLGRLLRISPN
jgi:hypothetical protein